MIPIRCIIQFAEKILREVSDPDVKKSLKLLLSTAKILKAKIQNPLDQNLIEKGFFESRVREAALLRTVRETISIMQS
jgi:hypothetical protein